VSSTRRTINGVDVEVGSLVLDPWLGTTVLGTSVRLGARCIDVDPERWVATILAGATEVWTSDGEFGSYKDAYEAAAAHTSSSLTRAVREIFE
jgi:hypothetical protein